MRRQIIVSGLALASFLASSAAPSVAQAFRQLKGSEIKAKFAGNEFTDEVHFAYRFDRNSRIAIASMGKQSAGKWRVDRDTLCLVADQPEERCYQVCMAGKNVELREPGNHLPQEGVLQNSTERR